MHKQSGFTLVELMMVIAVLGILVAIAYPSFESTIRLNKVQSQTTKLVTALAFARSEAVKTNQRIVICKSANQSTCTDAGSWEQGWIIFRSKDGDDALDADETILNVSGPITKKIVIRPGKGNLNDKVFAYRSDGTTGLIVADPESLSFKICYGEEVNPSRQIFIETSGRPRVDTAGVDSCLTE